MRTSTFHGKDGLGDAPDATAPGEEFIQSEHAVLALIKIINRYPGQIELITLGPLTNVALALRLDPHLGSKISKCFIMGGNYQGVGNTTAAAEFNFCCDPEAANVVLHELGIHITMVCWETCVNSGLDWESYHKLRAIKTTKNKFLTEIENMWVTMKKANNFKTLTCCDVLALAVLLDSTLVTSSFSNYCKVEVAGADTKGALVIDRKGYYGKPANVTIITGVDSKKYFDMLNKAIQV